MRRKSSGMGLPGRILLLGTGLLLLLYGLTIPLLPHIGQRAQGEITSIRRELGDRRDPAADSYSYAVGYEFTLPDGRLVYGNTKVIGSSINAGIPKGRTRVYYLPALPWVNALERDTRPGMGKVAILAAGAVLCLAAFRKARVTSARRR